MLKCLMLYLKTSGVDTRVVKLEFHATDADTDTDILANFRARILARKSTSRTRTTILADLSAELSDTCAFSREDAR